MHTTGTAGCCAVQMVNQARAELSGLSRQLHDTQRALAKSQAALAAAADTEAALRTQLQQLDQKQLEQQQQQQGHRQEQQQQQEQRQQQLQELKQQAEVLVSTPGKAQVRHMHNQPACRRNIVGGVSLETCYVAVLVKGQSMQSQYS